MPATYEELLLKAVPEVIETDEQYQTVMERFAPLFDKGRKGRTEEEEKLYRLLGLLIQDYDRRHALPPTNDTPAEKLQYLLEISAKTPADLIPIFGQKSHVSEALKGKRPISADQARKLGKLFKLDPGYFI
jgi:HTH-type transcriptional regulator / antitoxin HigA